MRTFFSSILTFPRLSSCKKTLPHPELPSGGTCFRIEPSPFRIACRFLPSLDGFTFMTLVQYLLHFFILSLLNVESLLFLPLRLFQPLLLPCFLVMKSFPPARPGRRFAAGFLSPLSVQMYHSCVLSAAGAGTALPSTRTNTTKPLREILSLDFPLLRCDFFPHTQDPEFIMRASLFFELHLPKIAKNGPNRGAPLFRLFFESHPFAREIVKC